MDLQQGGYFFLNVNDGFSLLESACQTGILGLKASVLLGQGIGAGFPAALFPGEPRECSFFPLLTPLAQMRRIQPLPAQNSADVTLLPAGFDLGQDRSFLLGAKTAPLGRGGHFRIGNRRDAGGNRAGVIDRIPPP